MATVMVAAAVFGRYFASHTGDPGRDLLDLLTGPVVMLVAVFAVARLLIAGRPPFTLWTGPLGARGEVAAVGGRGTWAVVPGGGGRHRLLAVDVLVVRPVDVLPR